MKQVIQFKKEAAESLISVNHSGYGRIFDRSKQPFEIENDSESLLFSRHLVLEIVTVEEVKKVDTKTPAPVVEPVKIESN